MFKSQTSARHESLCVAQSFDLFGHYLKISIFIFMSQLQLTKQLYSSFLTKLTLLSTLTLNVF